MWRTCGFFHGPSPAVVLVRGPFESTYRRNFGTGQPSHGNSSGSQFPPMIGDPPGVAPVDAPVSYDINTPFHAVEVGKLLSMRYLRQVIGPMGLCLLLVQVLGGQGRVRSSPGDLRRRVALVIGNAAYAQSPLRNPANDARSMKNTLEADGF